MISPEEMASLCLADERVKKENPNALFLKDAAVIVFDGLIVWRGHLNMEVAIDRLHVLAKAVGLPVAVVEGKDLHSLKRKKTNTGKLIGPYFWDQVRAWDSVDGLDTAFRGDYDKDGVKIPDGSTTEEKAEESADTNDEELDRWLRGYCGG